MIMDQIINPANNKPYYKFDVKEIYLQPDDPEENYYESAIFNSTHWGQRKLGLALIQFLTFYWDPQTNPNPIVVYAGAAPGINIDVVSKLFPRVQWHLYDPGNFDISATEKIHLYKEFFTDDVAKKWSNRNDVLFVSDIRRDIYASGSVQVESEQTIWEDMQAQARWYGIMKPVKAQLKFRLPFVSEELSQVFKRYVPYLNGDVYKGIWAPEHSTETRLVPNGYNYVHWDIKKYESQMFYFNIRIRGVKQYLNPYYPIDNEQTKVYAFNPIDPPELLNDYDSMAETYVWMFYLQKMYGLQHYTLENVLNMSHLLTFALNKYNPRRNEWETIHRKRIKTKLHELKARRKHAQKRLRELGTNVSESERMILETTINEANVYDFDTPQNVLTRILEYETHPDVNFRNFSLFILNKLK